MRVQVPPSLPNNKMKEQKIIIDEIYKSLQHQVNNLTPEKAIELYCFLNKKWGMIEYTNDGVALAVIKDQYK